MDIPSPATSQVRVVNMGSGHTDVYTVTGAGGLHPSDSSLSGELSLRRDEQHRYKAQILQEIATTRTAVDLLRQVTYFLAYVYLPGCHLPSRFQFFSELSRWESMFDVATIRLPYFGAYLQRAKKRVVELHNRLSAHDAYVRKQGPISVEPRYPVWGGKGAVQFALYR